MKSPAAKKFETNQMCPPGKATVCLVPSTSSPARPTMCAIRLLSKI